MKRLNGKILLILPIILFSAFVSVSQTDTTELNVGKKKLIIIDKKTQKENAIYNLEKGKESFEKQIAETEKTIEEHKTIIDKLYSEIDSLRKISGNLSDLSGNIKKELIDSIQSEIQKEAKKINGKSEIKVVIIEKNNDELEKIIEKKINQLLYEQEIEKLEAEIEDQKLLIELEQKKQQAFSEGIKDIDRGIAEIKNGIRSLDKELYSGTEKRTLKEINTGNIYNSEFNAHWAGFEFGFLNFLNAQNKLASSEELDYMEFIPEKTMRYRLNIIEYDISFSKNNRIGIATGAGLEWNSIALKQNVDLFEDEDEIIRAEYINPSDIKYKKNKFNTVYVVIPLIIEAQIPVKHRKMYMGAGITGGVRAWSKQKQKYEINGQTYKNKKVDDFQLSPFKYGATAIIGYGDIGMFINCDFTSLFNEGAGPEIFPVSVGLKVVDF